MIFLLRKETGPSQVSAIMNTPLPANSGFLPGMFPRLAMPLPFRVRKKKCRSSKHTGFVSRDKMPSFYFVYSEETVGPGICVRQRNKRHELDPASNNKADNPLTGQEKLSPGNNCFNFKG